MASRDEEILKREGVNKLLKSEGGREVVARLQKKYEKDLIQPGDPRFKSVYGAQMERQAQEKHKNEEKAKEMWERSEWEKRQKAEQGTDWKSKRL